MHLAVLSLHTSPLTQPGSGDSGGMNVYVRELVGSLAQAGVASDVFVRRWHPDLADVVDIEPGVRVVHVDAGPADLPKEDLIEVVPEFQAGVGAYIEQRGNVDVIHANYWLSGLAGHGLKHQLGLPLVSTFHTLARVKAETGDAEPGRRDREEASVMGCCDAILASCRAEAVQLRRLYDLPPEQIEIVPPGVDHAFFSPGDKQGARAALGMGDEPLLLFVGRIQPLKGLPLAIEALGELPQSDAHLLVVGGPSGPDGDAELEKAQALIGERGLDGRVHFVDPQPHHRLSTYYRAADVAIVPSRSESFGLVALEAAACGTPVVAADVGGLSTLVDQGETGYLIDNREPEAYAAAVATLLADPAAARDMGMRGAHRSQAYRWSTAAARLRRIYSDLRVGELVSC